MVKKIELFYVIENDKIRTILISYKTVRELETVEKRIKKIQSKGKIPGNYSSISWNRSISNINNKEDNKKLVEELEKKGIKKKSISLRLNPLY